MHDDVCLRPATELAALLRTRQLSAREVLDAHLDRIDAVEPGDQRDRDARRRTAPWRRADAADAAWPRGDERRPAARPADRAQGHPRHRRACARPGARRCAREPSRPATSWWWSGYRAAGAVRIGKTNVPEFAAGSHTFNPVFGVDAQPVPTRAVGRRVERRSGRRARRRPRAAGRGQRHGRLAAQSRRRSATSWAAADAGPGADLAGTMAVVDAVRPGADGAHRRRRRPAAVGDRRPRPAVADRAGRRPRGLRRAAARIARRAARRLGPGPGRPRDREPAITAVLAPSVAVFESLGAAVEEACPDLDGADDVFGTLRAWLFDAAYSDLAPAPPGPLKESIRWNAEMGAKLTGTDVGAGGAGAHASCTSGWSSSSTASTSCWRRRRRCCRSRSRSSTPTEIAGVPQENYLELDAAPAR